MLTKVQLQLNHPLVKFEGVHYDIEGNVQSNQEVEWSGKTKIKHMIDLKKLKN
jgi:hypothetical protein